MLYPEPAIAIPLEDRNIILNSADSLGEYSLSWSIGS